MLAISFFAQTWSTSHDLPGPVHLKAVESKINVNGKEASIFALKPNLLSMNGSDSNSFPLEARKNKGVILENMTPLFSEPRVRTSREKIISNLTTFIGSKLGLKQADGTFGLKIKSGDSFNVVLENELTIPTSIHWHGLILPNNQDGVGFITQFPIYPGESYHYQFPIVQSGTFWMHSHMGLQEQMLLSAPLILYGPEDSSIADQEAVIFLVDFSFKSPFKIYEDLRKNCKKSTDTSSMNSRPDIVEVDYDAFLANGRTLDNPEIVHVEAGKKVRLRLINGSSATNFFISLGDLEGDAIAVDGNRIIPLHGSAFELATAQRIDIIVQIPDGENAFPILAQGEGTNKQAGIVLSTKNAQIPRLNEKTERTAGSLTNRQEVLLRAIVPLKEKAIDRHVAIELGGNMADYLWTLNGQSWPASTPVIVEEGERVEIIFKNVSKMSHPMHLHGHVFQVTSIDGKEIKGAMRDTILVLPNSSIAIQFDADNPGVWPLHCHVLYHLESGMMTVVRYKNFIQPL